VTGNDGSCPSVYSSSHIIHYVLSTGLAQNPYTITLSSCSGSNCPPTEIIVRGWAGNEIVCGGTGTQSCSTSGPWIFNVDATVQASKERKTAPVKVTGSTSSREETVLILEAVLVAFALPLQLAFLNSHWGWLPSSIDTSNFTPDQTF
jgi:hypothetical protein